MLTACSAWATTASATIDQWDGANWTPQQAPLPTGGANPFLSDVTATSATSAWAAGDYLPASSKDFQPLIEHWNGSAWSPSPSPTVASGSGLLEGLDASSATDAWVVGDVQSSSGSTVLTSHWDGKSWTQVPAPSPATKVAGRDVADLSPTNAWMVGAPLFLGSAAPTGTAFIEHWDGTSWTVTPTPGIPADSLLISVSALSATDIWVVGATENQAANTSIPLVVHYDGTSWTVVPSVPRPGTSSELLGVAVTGTGALAAGDFTDTSGNTHSLVLRWDGTTWTQVPAASPGTNSRLAGVGGTSNNYWALGTSQTGGTVSPLALHCC